MNVSIRRCNASSRKGISIISRNLNDRYFWGEGGTIQTERTPALTSRGLILTSLQGCPASRP